ncbi:MAG TPA: PAS domain S-box protein [Tenuifilaceae bacterium]|nr:PAS domain S-box protein [Tenuifilaceae bacterium]
MTKGYLIGMLTRDVTKQKIVEAELKQHKEHLEELVKQKSNEVVTISGLYQKIFNHTSDAIAIISADFRLVEANPALQRMLGETDEKLYSGHIFDSIPATYHTIIKNSVELLFSGKSINPLEIEIQNKNGIKIPVELSANIIDYNNSAALLSIIRDISDRREMEKMILLTTIEAEERERRRLAADLHDDIGPLLASLKMYVSVLQQRLLNTSNSEVLDIIQNLIKSSIENVRTISNNISPHLIERFGLIPAVKAEIENIKMLVPVDFTTNASNYKFDKQVEIIIYRIIKELFNNTLKYAKAKRISLNINYHKYKLYLKYSDNGLGFDLATTVLDKKSGHGLPNIDNRIKSINGNYSIETSHGNGFIFILDVPVNLR